MTSKILSASILAVAAFTSVSSFAEDSGRNFFADQPVTSSTSRAEVRAQLQQAEKQGYDQRIANDYPAAIVAAAPTSSTTRAQVKADLLASSPADRAVYN